MASISGFSGHNPLQSSSSMRQPTAITPGVDRSSLSSGISNTNNEKPFSDVVLAARAALDASYERLGKRADGQTHIKEWKEAVGLAALDRRTLYAIASNQGGLFSEGEITAAQSVVTDRHSKAMFSVDPTGRNMAAILKASIDYLDQASPEEKASLGWAQARAASQRSYEQRMRDEGRTPENVESGNPLVKLFVKASDELVRTNDPFGDITKMPSYIKAVELWNLQQETTQPLSWIR